MPFEGLANSNVPEFVMKRNMAQCFKDMTGELLVKLDKKGLPQIRQYLTSYKMLFMFQIFTSHMMI